MFRLLIAFFLAIQPGHFLENRCGSEASLEKAATDVESSGGLRRRSRLTRQVLDHEADEEEEEDVDYPDHSSSQSNLNSLDYWGAIRNTETQIFGRQKSAQLERMRSLSRDPVKLDSIIGVFEALSARPKMQRLIASVLKSTFIDILTSNATASPVVNDVDPEDMPSEEEEGLGEEEILGKE